MSYLAFLVLLYGYILPRNDAVLKSPHLYTLTSFAILLVVGFFCYRARNFGNVLDTIDTKHFTLDQGGNVKELFWPKPDPRYNDKQFLCAVIVVFASFLASFLRIYGFM